MADDLAVFVGFVCSNDSDEKIMIGDGYLCTVKKNGKEEIIVIDIDTLLASGLLHVEAESASCVAAETEPTAESKWTDPATKLLISLYDECFTKLKDTLTFTKKRLWQLIAKEMAAKGYNFSNERVKNKWAVLERAFKEKVAGNKTTGSNKKSCAFDKELTEVLSRKSAVIPECLLGTDTEITKSQIMARAGIPCATASTSKSSTGEEEEDIDDPGEMSASTDTAAAAGASTAANGTKGARKRERPRNVLEEVKKMREELARRCDEREADRKKASEEKQLLRLEESRKKQEAIQERNRILDEKNALTRRWLEWQMNQGNH